MKRPARWIRLLVAGLFLLVLAGAGLFAFADPIMDAAGGLLAAEDEIEKSDLLFVPSGNPMIRFRAAVDLLEAGAADRILINLEGQSEAERKWRARYGDAFSADRLVAHMAAVDGVPPEKVIVSKERAISTAHDFAILDRRLAAEKIDSVIVVTSGTHLRRCRMVAARTIGDRARFLFVAADRPDPDRYISRPKRALDLFVAYLKWVYYWMTFHPAAG